MQLVGQMMTVRLNAQALSSSTHRLFVLFSIKAQAL